MSELTHQAVQIVLFICLTYGLRILTDALMRYLLIRRNSSEELVRTLLREESALRRQATLRWGLILAFGSAALLIIQWTGWTDDGPGPIALVVGGVALGNLIFYALTRQTTTG